MPIVNTISFNGYIFNEATVETLIEEISGGTSAILLIFAYLALGRVDSVTRLLTPLRTAGILVIMISIILLATVRNRIKNEESKSGLDGARPGNADFSASVCCSGWPGDSCHRDLPGYDLWLQYAGGRQYYHRWNGICGICPGMLDLYLSEGREAVQSLYQGKPAQDPRRGC